MGRFLDAYLIGVEFLSRNRATDSRRAEHMIGFFRALPEKAVDRLEAGDYPPYHLIKVACRAVSVPTETAKYWLQGFLYWRQHSLPVLQPDGRPEEQA
jgi:hypothetical protein